MSGATKDFASISRPARPCVRAESEAAAAEIGELTERQLLIAGAIAYWCEGTKSKPPHNSERVVFVNSDPGLIRFSCASWQAWVLTKVT